MGSNLENKLVVITGGAQGIGYEIASNFLKQRAKTVLILDINEAKGLAAINDLNSEHGKGRADFIKCDVTKDLDEVSKKIFESYGRVDVLVNNAGSVDETSARKTLELNAIALIEWTMKFWEQMRTDKGGSGGTIINVGSIYSFIIDPYLVFYKASKFAVQGFTRSLGHENNYKKFGVRLLVIFPGYTYSPLTERQHLCWDEHSDEFTKFLETQEWQDAQEVGKAAVTIFQDGRSGSSWKIAGGKLSEVQFFYVGE